MALDYEKLMAWQEPEIIQRYSIQDTILYGLSLGYGSNPIDQNELCFVYEKKLEAINNPLTVIFRGKVNSESGFSLILEAARRMNGIATFIFVIGLKDQCLDPSENVVIVREITNSEMHYMYEFSDIAIGQFSDHARLRYTIPHKAFEAGFYSKCYISADAVGVREIFNEESVVLLKEISSSSLEGTIRSLAPKRVREKYCKNINRNYLKNLSQEGISNQFDQILIRLLSHHSK